MTRVFRRGTQVVVDAMSLREAAIARDIAEEALAAVRPFASRAAAQAAIVPADTPMITVIHAGLGLDYIADPNGTALTTADGQKWSPGGEARPEHWGAMRDGTTNDRLAIQSACDWATKVQLDGRGDYFVDGAALRLTNTLLTGGNHEWPESRRAQIVGGPNIPVADPLIAPVRSGKLEHVRLFYRADAITGSETEGQRRLIGDLAGQTRPQRGCSIKSVRLERCGTGIGGLSFSVSYTDVEITDFTFAGMDVGRGTGNAFRNIYINNNAGQSGRIATYGMRVRNEWGGVYDQINVEHTYCREAAVWIDNCPSVNFGALHIEGVDTTEAGKRFVYINSGAPCFSSLTAIYCGMTYDNTAFIELGSAVINTGHTTALTGVSSNSRLFINALRVEGLTNPNVGLHPAYPFGRRGLQNIPGFKFIRRAAAFTDANFQVEVGTFNHGSFVETGGEAEATIYREAHLPPWSDIDRLTVLRFGLNGPMMAGLLERSFESFGARGDGVADDTAALQAAHDWMIATGRKIVGTRGAEYRITAGITAIGNVNVDWRDATVFVDANVSAISYQARLMDVQPLSADYVPGATTIAVDALAEAPEPGSVVTIMSNAIDPGQRHSGSRPGQYRRGERFVVGAGSTTTAIALMQPLARVDGVDPASSAVAGYDRIPAYTTAMNARVVVMRPDRCVVENLTLRYPEGKEGDGWNGRAIELAGYLEPLIRNYRQTRGYQIGINLRGNISARVEGGYIARLQNNTSAGQFGYAVADNSDFSQIIGVTFDNCRHGYDTGSSRQDEDEPDHLRTIGAPGARGGRVIGCVGINFGDSSSPFGGHMDQDDVVYLDCQAINCRNWAWTVRGRNIHVVRPIVRNCERGINVYTELNSGDPDDGLFTAGRSIDDFTSCTITGADIECTADPLDFRTARTWVDGSLRVRIAAHKWLNQNGGLTWFNASGSVEVTDFDGAVDLVASGTTGGIEMNPPASAASTVFPKAILVFGAGSDLWVDLSQSAATGPRISRQFDPDCEVYFNGRMRVLLGNDCSLIFGTTGVVGGEETGLLTYEVVGKAGNDITTNLSGRQINVRSTDGLIDHRSRIPKIWGRELSLLVGDPGRAFIASRGSDVLELEMLTSSIRFRTESRSLRLDSDTRVEVHHNGAERLRTTDDGVRLSGLPTSAAGLATGDLWNDGGTVKIVT